MKQSIISLLLLICIFFTGSVVQSATTNSITQWGITWTFDKAYEYGQFANGDYWVKTDSNTKYVRVTRIQPDTTNFDGKIVNGWEVNPGTSRQGFDGRITAFDANLIPSLPYNATAGKSLIKAISITPCPNAGCRPALKTVSVLTVLGSAPPNNGATIFRPPYVGNNKPLRSISEIKWDRVPSYAPVANAPSLSWIVNRIGKVQMDHIRGNSGQFRPEDHIPFYGADINQEHGDAVLRLLLNDSQQAKTPAMIAVIQGGIDHYHFILEGQTWPRGGGEQPGRIILPLFASYILGDTQMQQTVTTRSDDGHYPYETFILSRRPNSNGVVLWGDTTGTESVYWDKLEGGHSAPGSATIRDPYGYIDGGYSPGGVYQECCTSQGFKQTALILALVPGLKDVWSFSDEVVSYADRWVNHGTWTKPDPCAPVGGTRGVHYGPDPKNPGECIKGSGRFPSRHGTKADGGLRYSNFAAEMWYEYRYNPISSPSTGDDPSSPILPPSGVKGIEQ